MTTSSTLSRERLEELAKLCDDHAAGEPWPFNKHIGLPITKVRALIAQAMRTEQAERERDALREVMRQLIESRMEGEGWCKECHRSEGWLARDGHREDCTVRWMAAALAEPDAGGDAS